MIHKEKNKIALFVCHDLVGLMIINELVPKILEKGLVPAIYNTGNKRNRRVIVPAPAAPSFYGAGIVDEVLLPFLDSKPVDKNTQGLHHTYKHLAEIHGFPYHEIGDVNDSDFQDEIANDPTIQGGLSIRFLQVFDQSTIEIFENKGFFWNLHGGSLPDYKGLLIPYRAIENGEKQYGWTLHKMAKGIDAGDIIDIAERKLNRLKPIFNTYADMIPYGVNMITEVLQEFLENGTYRSHPQESVDKKNYYPYPTEDEMDRYSRMGIQFVGDPNRHMECMISKFTHPSSKEATLLRQALQNAALEWQRRMGQESLRANIQMSLELISQMAA